MNILLTGADGQIGTALRQTAPAHARLICCYRELPHGKLPPGQAPEQSAAGARQQAIALDLSNADAVAAMLRQHDVDLIINAAAWTAVDEAEQQPQAAMLMNAGLPRQLAAHAYTRDIPLLHYSTDYVYDGASTEAYVEDDVAAPLNHYGRGKLAGDRAIIASGCKYLLLRTSWVYGGPGKNFLHTIAGKLLQGGALNVVDDQVGCPTWSVDIARCSWLALEKMRVQQAFSSGLYHLAGSAAMSWYEFAVHIQQALAQMTPLPAAARIDRCGSHAYSQLAKRPAKTILNSSAFGARFGAAPGGADAIIAAASLYARDKIADRG